MAKMETEAEIERLPIDLLAYTFFLLPSFRDLALASGVCKKWRWAALESLAGRKRLSFADQRMDDESTARLVCAADKLKELNISRSCWGCRITDEGLFKISSAKCIGKLTSISLWGMAGITDSGVINLIQKAKNMEIKAVAITVLVQNQYWFQKLTLCNLNIGGTFITDESLYAIANHCPNLKTIILWSCRQVTESGLIALVNKCRKLESINVGGMRVPLDCFTGLCIISPALQIKSVSQHLNISTQVA
ncbi:F-box family protein-like [Rhynchospora pubera]|uniref:F-box family protein-like n=1 Tax=Rhynchospora pubera TaxID=906938 RepID=A0AAV8FNH6_9POAL|nr:F-box family protein-like [Rhynchospora pubera]